MLARFDALLLTDESFAIETTLSTRSYHEKIGLAKTRGFDVILLFFWLPSIDMAVKRVKTRVEEGGHFVEPAIIERRYKRGIVNLFSLYLDAVDLVLIFDNSDRRAELIAEKEGEKDLCSINDEKCSIIKNQYDEYKRY